MKVLMLLLMVLVILWLLSSPWGLVLLGLAMASAFLEAGGSPATLEPAPPPHGLTSSGGFIRRFFA